MKVSSAHGLGPGLRNGGFRFRVQEFGFRVFQIPVSVETSTYSLHCSSFSQYRLNIHKIPMVSSRERARDGYPDLPKSPNQGIYLKSYYGSYNDLRYIPELRDFGRSGWLCRDMELYSRISSPRPVEPARLHCQGAGNSIYIYIYIHTYIYICSLYIYI